MRFPVVRDGELESSRKSVTSPQNKRATYIDSIVKRTMLSDGYEHGLVVCCRVDGRQLVEASRKTVRDIGSKLAALGSRVQALEKNKLPGIGRRGLVQGCELFHDDMRVADDLALLIELLGSRKKVLLGVDKCTSLHVLDVHLDRERRVRLDGSKVDGESEFGGRHVVGTWDNTHGRRVARTGGDLLSVGDGKVGYGQTEVDKVVLGSERRDLACCGYVLAVVCKTGGDNPRI